MKSLFTLMITFALMVSPALAMETKQKVQCVATHISRADAAAKWSAHYDLEVADSHKEREHGLMNRDAIGPCEGMVFFFPVAEVQKFWMKNTRIPLDMLFVDAHGKIVDIITAEPFNETPVGPDVPVLTVVEIEGGRAGRDGIKVGDHVSFGTTNRSKRVTD